MASPPNKDCSGPGMEAAAGFVLGAVAGCALGAVEGPINQVMTELTDGPHLRVLMADVREVGPLGVGTLLGATALTTAMASAVTGITLAALVALAVLRTKGQGHESESPKVGPLLWVSCGLAAAFGATAGGGLLGTVTEMLSQHSGAAGLLGGLVVFTLLKPLLRVALRLGAEQDPCGGLPDEEYSWGGREEEEEEDEEEEQERRHRDDVVEMMEQRITVLEEEGGAAEERHRDSWEAEWRERRQAEQEQRERRELRELETERRSVNEHITRAMAKYVDFLAFSGIPMTVTAMVTTGFGLLGYGEYRFLFLVLLGLVVLAAFLLLRAAQLRFWMFAGCMGVFATFAIAILTVHAGQEVASANARMRAAGRPVPPRESVLADISESSSLEAVAAGFFVAKLCQVGIGATAGGPLGRNVDGKVAVGAAGATAAILGLVQGLGGALGVGGRAGALLGAVGAAGVSLGSAAGIAVGWSTWAGTVVTTVGIVTGALATGKWDVPNLIQVPVAYMFAMNSPF